MRRRRFLQNSAAAAAAAMLHACARDEVAFIEQAVARSPHGPGESVWRGSVCQQCPAGCGVRVRLVDGDAKKLEGHPAHPVNRGGLCALGQAAVQELYHPDRLRGPWRLSRGQPSGAEPLDWEVALEELAQRLARAARSSPQGVWIGCGSVSWPAQYLWRRLAAALGLPPPVRLRSVEWEVEREAARRLFGLEDWPYFDLERADLVLSFGAPYLERWRSPVHYARALAEQRQEPRSRRGRSIHVEARLSATAAAVDRWIPVRPGGEGWLARAIARELLALGRASERAAAHYRRWFPGPDPPPESLATRCGVPQEAIAELARELAESERPLVLAGGPMAAQRHGLFHVAAALALNVLLGNLGREGGVLRPRRFDLERNLPPAPPLATLAAGLQRLRGQAPQAIVICDADPVHMLPPASGVEQALHGASFVAVMAQFLDDTALLADLCLPLHAPLERFDIVEPEAALHTAAIGVGAPLVEPLGATRHPGDIALALARALEVGEALAWPSVGALVEQVLQDLHRRTAPGGTGDFWSFYEDVLDRGGLWEERPALDGLEAAAPREPIPEPKLDRDASREPSLLLAFETHVRTAEGRGLHLPWIQQLPDLLSTVMWDSWIEMARADARRIGVRTGDRVRVSVEGQAAFEAFVVESPAAAPGVLALPLGGGQRDYGRWARERGVNPLRWLGAGEVEGVGLPAWGPVRARVEAAGPGRAALFGRGLRAPEDRPLRR